jgi:methionyl-tRNA formyltransferase
VSDPGFEEPFRRLGADVAVVVDFGEILRPFVFEWTACGFFGVHPSLLPRWRGAAPIPWTILSGDRVAGVSVFRLSASVDTGNLAFRGEVTLDDRDTSTTLGKRLGRAGAAALLDVVDRLEGGNLTEVSQPAEGATVARKLERRDGFLRWEFDARRLDAAVRALAPWPCAWFTVGGRDVKVLRSVPLDVSHAAAPGTVLGWGTPPGESEGVRIACGSGELVLLELQSTGRRPLPAPEWLRGARLSPGDVLSSSMTEDGGGPP